MKRFCSLLLAVAGLPLLVHAQTARTTAAVTDADAKVPPPTYQSAFADYQRFAEPDASPDKGWIQANRQVSGQAQQGPAAGSSMAMPPATKPAETPKTAPVDDPHKGHQMKMKGD
ncbi:MAG: hypothetical protein M3R60_04705 [Pseudomonadota bacterium]|nr:hypothetical protein [Pseudomonadota bacterium]